MLREAVVTEYAFLYQVGSPIRCSRLGIYTGTLC